MWKWTWEIRPPQNSGHFSSAPLVSLIPRFHCTHIENFVNGRLIHSLSRFFGSITLIHSLTHSLTHLLTHSLTHPPPKRTQTQSRTHSVTHSLTRSFTEKQYSTLGTGLFLQTGHGFCDQAIDSLALSSGRHLSNLLAVGYHFVQFICLFL